MNRVLWALLLLALLQTPALGHAQKINYDAATGDSVALYGLWPVSLENGDTALMFVLRSFAATGDTVTGRKEALGWWPWLSAQVKVRGYPWAGINVIWPKDPADSLFDQGVAAKYSVLFGRDKDGCWHLLGDTVQVSTCSPLSRQAAAGTRMQLTGPRVPERSGDGSRELGGAEAGLPGHFGSEGGSA